MAIAGGIPCDVDPLLYNVMKTHCGKTIVISMRLQIIIFNWQKNTHCTHAA